MDRDRLVFVSYAHADKEFLDGRLLPFLRNLELGEQIELWHDQLIGVGENWYAEIANRLDHAKVAILLITPAFLGSKFCLHEEVPVLLQRARRGELRVLPLFVRHCLWDNEPWLKRIQMWPADGNALSEYAEPRQDRLMTEFSRMVLDAVSAPAQAIDRERLFDEPHGTHDLHRMPQTGSLLFGRRGELRLLDEAWEGDTNVIAFTAGGGVGKSTLARVWAEMLAEDDWRGAERAFAWSFYSQGTGRKTDAEAFIDYALEWFGDGTPEGLSLWDRGERLAECVRRRRTLLILDGVEPLQSSDKDVDQGSVRDPGLRTLLEELAKENPGLCVVTTRERLTDLVDYDAPMVLHQDLEQVSKHAGRALLRVNRIQGKDSELDGAVEEVGSHALAVSLLSSLLTDENASPHVSNAKLLPPLEYSIDQGGHPRRVLDAWATRLGEGAELELLQIIGLFDRPATRDAIRAVIDGYSSRGLNSHLRTTALNDVLEQLRAKKLIVCQSMHEDTIDAHPVIRDHFGQWLNANHVESWKEGHRRLYEYYKEQADYLPDELVGMQPLFAAVAHGCKAGLYDEVLINVYNERIRRGKAVYVIAKLGAIASDLSCIFNFFSEPWTRPQKALESPAQSWVLAEAGTSLKALGRLQEATYPLEQSFQNWISEERWQHAGTSAGNLSDLYMLLGRLEDAEARAQDANRYANRSDDKGHQIAQQSRLAHVLHQRGTIADARALFAKADQVQKDYSAAFPILHSMTGFLYCDLLLSEGATEEVIRRAQQTLNWATERGLLLDMALDRLSLGRAHMAESPPDLDAAERHLKAAVDGLRKAGMMDHFPRGLLARSQMHRIQNNFDLAQRDLDEVQKIVGRTGMRIFAADLALEKTRLKMAVNDHESARECLQEAANLVRSMNYGRRIDDLRELESELGTELRESELDGGTGG